MKTTTIQVEQLEVGDSVTRTLPEVGYTSDWKRYETIRVGKIKYLDNARAWVVWDNGKETLTLVKNLRYYEAAVTA